MKQQCRIMSPGDRAKCCLAQGDFFNRILKTRRVVGINAVSS